MRNARDVSSGIHWKLNGFGCPPVVVFIRHEKLRLEFSCRLPMRIELFEREADRIDQVVTGGAASIRNVFAQAFAVRLRLRFR